MKIVERRRKYGDVYLSGVIRRIGEGSHVQRSNVGLEGGKDK
mgnify:CR=1 FL=1